MIVVDEISEMSLAINKLSGEQKMNLEKEKSEIRTKEYERQMASIQPKLIEAMITLGGVKTTNGNIKHK